MFTKKLFLTGMACFFVTPAFAMLCPTNFSEINYGDSLEAVKQQCGMPDSEKESEAQSDEPQEWNYYIQVDPNNAATLKTTVAFVKGKATNISSGGTSLSSTTICAGNSINVGDTQAQITAACGKPAFINQSNVTPATKTKIVDIIYNSATQPVTLEFENGIFKSKK